MYYKKSVKYFKFLLAYMEIITYLCKIKLTISTKDFAKIRKKNEYREEVSNNYQNSLWS